MRDKHACEGESSKKRDVFYMVAMVLTAMLFTLASASRAAEAKEAATADLFGMVEDPQGAAVAAANIALLPVGRNVALVTVTDQQGRFEFHRILPGSYRLTAETPVFVAVWARIINALKLLAPRRPFRLLRNWLIQSGQESGNWLPRIAPIR